MTSIQRYSVFVLLAALLAAAVQAAPPRVAVVGMSNYHHVPALANMHEVLAHSLEIALQQTGRFAVIERSRLDALLKEKNLAADGIIRDPEKTVAALQLPNVDYLITGVLQGDALATQAEIKFIRASGPEAGRQAYAFTAVGVTVPYVSYLAYDLSEEAADAFPLAGKVISVADEAVIINLGERDGLRVGEELLVQQLGEAVHDAGAVVFQSRTDIGRVKVLEVQPGGARASLIGKATVTPGMAVVSPPRLRPQAEEGNRRRLTVGATTIVAPLQAFEGQWTASLLTTELAKRQKVMNVRLVEREHLQRVFEEMGLVENGLFDRTTAAKAGGLLTPDLIVGTTLLKRGDNYQLNARVIPSATGEAQLAVVKSGPDLDKLVEEVASACADLLKPAELLPLGQTQIEGRVAFNYDVVPTGQYDYLIAPALVDYSFDNKGDTSLRLRLTTGVPGYARDFVQEVTLAPGEHKQIAQTPPLDPEKVAGITTPASTQISCKVALAAGGPPLLEDALQVRLLPARSWLARLKTRKGPSLVADCTIVAWLRDNSEALAAVRTEAAGLCKMRGLYGYQPTFLNPSGWPTDTREQQRAAVRAQVGAVYQALGSRGIAYVEDARIDFPANAGQNVLLPDQVLAKQRANCLDGTILFASVLMPSFDPLLIITDTHAFVGWRTWSDAGATWDVLDTTLLAVKGSTFEQALERGRQEAAKVGLLEKLEQTGEMLDFGGTGELTPPVPGVVVIDARRARSYLEAHSAS
ncbi:MAG: CsgG/HfaB family protein [Armatimonadia bacterium]